jgi:hypothetical protein
MKPPYPNTLSDALKTAGDGQAGPHEYADILREPELTAEFIRQRLASKRQWFAQKGCTRSEAESWQDKVLRVVYEENLGIQVPRDGDVVYKHGNLLIVDWRSWCPVLTYCAHRGQPTAPVCSVLYHMQLQCLLSLVLPGALFTRDYSTIRPRASCCREIIFYDGAECAQGTGGHDTG